MLVGSLVTCLLLMLAAVALLIERVRVGRSLRSLRRTHAMSQATLRALPDLMFLQTRDGTYLDYHARGTAELYVLPEQFIGRNMHAILPPDLAAVLARELAAVDDTDDVRKVEYSLPIGGATKYYEARLVFCPPDLVLSIVRDITERKVAEHNLENARLEVVRAGRLSAMGELTATIAHEMSQPLSAVIANTSICLRALLRHDLELHELTTCLHEIERDARRASDIAQHTREMFRHVAPKTARVDVNDVVRHTLALMHTRLSVSAVTVEALLADDLPRVNGDSIALQQVVLNLLMNADDAMAKIRDRHRRLEVRTTRLDSASIALTVRDTGPGIPGDQVDAIFRPFFSTKAAGMGVGLSISRSIVESHGGRLQSVPVVGVGAMFEMTLPVMETEPD